MLNIRPGIHNSIYYLENSKGLYFPLNLIRVNKVRIYDSRVHSLLTCE